MTTKQALPNDVERLYASRDEALKAYAMAGRDDVKLFECGPIVGIALTEHRFRKLVPVVKIGRAEATQLIFQSFGNGEQ